MSHKAGFGKHELETWIQETCLICHVFAGVFLSVATPYARVKYYIKLIIVILQTSVILQWSNFGV